MIEFQFQHVPVPIAVAVAVAMPVNDEMHTSRILPMGEPTVELRRGPRQTEWRGDVRWRMGTTGRRVVWDVLKNFPVL